jgi:hypothetical protein
MNIRRNPFSLMAGMYLLLDSIALSALVLVMLGVIPSVPGLDWVRIHLLTIGVVVQSVLGALPALVATKLRGKRPSAAVTWTLWLLVNISFGLLLYSMPLGFSALAAGAAVGIFAAIVLLLASMYRQKAIPPVGAHASLRFYVAGPFFFLIGILMAISMLLNWPAPGQFFGLLEAHVHANVWGFLALVVAGFLLARIPTYVGRPLRWPTLVPATSWLLITGAVGLVAGPWLGFLPLTLLGIVVYMVGTVLLLSNLAGTILASRIWTPNLAHLVVAYLWMVVPAIVAPLVLALTGHLPTGRIEAAAVSGLVAGWILQIVIGAFPLWLREGQPHTVGRDGWWFSVVALNVGVLIVWISAFTPDLVTARMLTALAYTFVVLGLLPPLVTILVRVLGGEHASGHA